MIDLIDSYFLSYCGHLSEGQDLFFYCIFIGMSLSEADHRLNAGRKYCILQSHMALRPLFCLFWVAA